MSKSQQLDFYSHRTQEENMKTQSERPFIQKSIGQKINFQLSNLPPVMLEEETINPIEPLDGAQQIQFQQQHQHNHELSKSGLSIKSCQTHQHISPKPIITNDQFFEEDNDISNNEMNLNNSKPQKKDIKINISPHKSLENYITNSNNINSSNINNERKSSSHIQRNKYLSKQIKKQNSFVSKNRNISMNSPHSNKHHHHHNHLNNNISSSTHPHNKQSIQFSNIKHQQDSHNLDTQPNNNEDICNSSHIKNKLFHDLQVQLKVQRFIQALKYRLPYKGFTQLKPVSVRIINDLAFSTIQNCHIKANKLNKFKSGIHQKMNVFFSLFNLKKNLKTIEDDSFIKLMWDLILIFCIILNLFFMPIDLVQDGEPFITRYKNTWKPFMILSLIIFIFDILLQFNIETQKEGIIIKDRWIIAQLYTKQMFIIDLLSTVPIIIQLFNTENQFFRFLYVLILLKSITILKIVQRMMDRYVVEKQIFISFQFIHLIMISLLIAHVFAIIFYGLQNLQKNYWDFEEYWIKSNDLLGKDWTYIYMYAVYFSTTTMTTVGYGDMLPVSIEEMGFVIFMMIVASGVFAYVLTCIGEIIMETNRENKDYKTEMHLVNRYLNNKNIHQNLKNEVRSYISYKIKLENSLSVEEEEQVVKQLPQRLKSKINMTSNIQILEQCKLFKKFDKQKMQEVASSFTEFIVQENDVIFEENTHEDNPKIYFILQGEIEIYVESNNGQFQTTQFEVLSPGKSFGEYSFFTNQKRRSGAKALQTSTILSISRQEFIDIIKISKQDFEIFHMIENLIIFSSQYNNKKSYQTDFLNLNCFLCLQPNHDIANCPYIHFVPDKESIILKNNYSVPQKRKNTDKDQRAPRFNPKFHFENINEAVYNIQQDIDYMDGGDHNHLNFQLMEDNELINSYDEDLQFTESSSCQSFDGNNSIIQSQHSMEINSSIQQSDQCKQSDGQTKSKPQTPLLSNSNNREKTISNNNAAAEKRKNSIQQSQGILNTQMWVLKQQQKQGKKQNNPSSNNILKNFVKNQTVVENPNLHTPNQQTLVVSPALSKNHTPRATYTKKRNSSKFEEFLKKKDANSNQNTQAKQTLQGSSWLPSIGTQIIQQNAPNNKRRSMAPVNNQQQLQQIQHNYKNNFHHYQTQVTQTSKNTPLISQNNPQQDLQMMHQISNPYNPFTSVQRDHHPQQYPINYHHPPIVNLQQSNIFPHGILQQGRANMKKDMILNHVQTTTTEVGEIMKYNADGTVYIEEKPYMAIKYFPEYNFNPKKMVMACNKYQPFNSGFGVYTFANRFKSKLKAKNNTTYYMSQRMRNNNSASTNIWNKRQQSISKSLTKKGQLKGLENHHKVNSSVKRITKDSYISNHPIQKSKEFQNN